jgi:hypothetical protein
MSLDRLLNLGSEQAPADPTLAGFTLRQTVIEHQIFQAAIREIARIHKRGLTTNSWEGMLLIAQTGTGKSTLLKYYADQFPRSEGSSGTEIPVLYVSTPEFPTVRDLAEAVLDALGDPAADRGTTRAKTRRIVHFIKQCGVQVLLIDEFQHFADGSSKEAKRVSDWLKLLMDAIKRPVVLAGLPRSIAVVNRNPQLRRRLGAPYYMRPFAYQRPEQRTVFRTVLKKIHGMIPAQCECPPLHSVELTERFYYASLGLLDYVIKVVETAVSKTAQRYGGKVTMAALADAFEEAVWRFAPKELNPFSPKPILRPLRKRGEPFEVWDSIEKYMGVQKRRAGGGSSAPVSADSDTTGGAQA